MEVDDRQSVCPYSVHTIDKNADIGRMWYMAQGRLLKELRVEKGTSQEEVAEYLGMSRPTYVALEQGRRELTLSEAEKVSRMYELSLEEIFAGKKVAVQKIINLPKKAESKIEPRINIPQERIPKFKQVLLYILSKTAGKPNVGMTVLYKLLYFIDFDYYEKHDEQLMGLRYIKNTHGPTPKMFAAVVRNMQESGDLANDSPVFVCRICSNQS